MPMGGRPVASRNSVGAFVSVHPHRTVGTVESRPGCHTDETYV